MSSFSVVPFPLFQIDKNNWARTPVPVPGGLRYRNPIPLEFLIQGLHFYSINHTQLGLVFLPKNVSRGFKQPTTDTASFFKQNKFSHCVIMSLKWFNCVMGHGRKYVSKYLTWVIKTRTYTISLTYERVCVYIFYIQVYIALCVFIYINSPKTTQGGLHILVLRDRFKIPMWQNRCNERWRPDLQFIYVLLTSAELVWLTVMKIWHAVFQRGRRKQKMAT